MILAILRVTWAIFEGSRSKKQFMGRQVGGGGVNKRGSQPEPEFYFVAVNPCLAGGVGQSLDIFIVQFDF